jgi:hypothetical protein
VLDRASSLFDGRLLDPIEEADCADPDVTLGSVAISVMEAELKVRGMTLPEGVGCGRL